MPDPRIFPIEDSRIDSQPVDNVSGVILNANQSRCDCDLTNVGTEFAFLARGEAAVLLSGIPLTPNGGTYHIGTNNMWYGTIEAICVNGNAIIAISEGDA